MSIFHEHPSEIRQNLDELPSHHTKEDIIRLVESLQADFANDPPDLAFLDKVKRHADQHRELFFRIRCSIGRCVRKPFEKWSLTSC